jgi:hypothetical protein
MRNFEIPLNPPFYAKGKLRLGDTHAEQFAAILYKALALGHCIGEALREGRKRVMELKSVDWADYIHYGSPAFVVKRRT